MTATDTGLHVEEIPRISVPVVRPETEIAKRFASDTASHRMRVLHDDGLYRHIRFQEHRLCNDAEYRPYSSSYWFDLVTWPGALTINGDCGTFTFTREPDMFGFFRCGSRYGINPQYWGEKVRAGVTRKYSPDLFREQVAEEITEAGQDYPGLAAAVEEQFYGTWAEYNTDFEADARRALDEFRFAPEGMPCPACKEDGVVAILVPERPFSDTLKCPEGCGTKAEPFRFTDTWEWNLEDYDHWFLWCCHAIQWGIAQYDASRAVTA